MGFWVSKILIVSLCLIASSYSSEVELESIESIEAELPFLKTPSKRRTKRESARPPKGFVTNDTFLDLELAEGREKSRGRKRKRRLNKSLKTISKYDEFDQFEK